MSTSTPTNKECCNKCFVFGNDLTGCIGCPCHTDKGEKNIIETRMDAIRENLRLSNNKPIYTQPESKGWEKRFDDKFGGTLETVRANSGVIKSFISREIEVAEQRGKSYWEPSEYHKDIWRKQGRADAEAEHNECMVGLTEAADEMFVKGKARGRLDVLAEIEREFPKRRDIPTHKHGTCESCAEMNGFNRCRTTIIEIIKSLKTE